MKVKLPILFNTESLQILDNNDIDFDLRLCKIAIITFYQISAITKYIENDIEYCQIYSNGTSYYSSLTENEVEQIIDKQKQLEFIQ